MIIFEKIIEKKESSYLIHEDENYMSFLDINPIAIGHTLVIPKSKNDYIFDLEDYDLGNIFIYCKKIAKAIEKAINCRRVGIGVSGFTIPYTHIHLVPINKTSDMNPMNDIISLDSEELEFICKKISKYI